MLFFIVFIEFKIGPTLGGLHARECFETWRENEREK